VLLRGFHPLILPAKLEIERIESENHLDVLRCNLGRQLVTNGVNIAIANRNECERIDRERELAIFQVFPIIVQYIVSVNSVCVLVSVIVAASNINKVIDSADPKSLSAT
jgi:hypothetical protein